MKKIDYLFLEFPNLKIIEKEIREIILKDKNHIITKLFEKYAFKKTKEIKELALQLDDVDNIKRSCTYLQLKFKLKGNFHFHYINYLFEKTKTLTNFRKLRKNLLTSTQFYSALSELETNAFFSKYIPVFEPSIKDCDNKLDSKIQLVDRPVYFEIFSPENTIVPNIGAQKLENKMKGKIKDKIINQINPFCKSATAPIVLVINISDCKWNEQMIVDAFLGQQACKICFDKNNLNDYSATPIRLKNGLLSEELDLSYLSLIVVYSRNLFKFKICDFTKFDITNENAKYPLTKKELKIIRTFDLRKYNRDENG